MKPIRFLISKLSGYNINKVSSLKIQKEILTKLTFLFLWLCASIQVWSQEIENLRFEQNDVLNQNLSSPEVHSIVTDDLGFVWIGTSKGLNRFDGYEVKKFNHQITDSTTLFGNNVEDIYQDTKGNLWVGTTYGLNLYNKEQDNFISRFNLHDHKWIPRGRITQIYEDNDGELWVCSDLGLYRYLRDQKNFIYVSPDNDIDGLKYKNVHHIFQDSEGQIWVALQDRIAFFDKSKNIFYTNPNVRDFSKQRLTKSYSSFIIEDKYKNIWIGSRFKALSCYERSTGKFRKFQSRELEDGALRNSELRSAMIGRDGNVWFTTAKGLYMIEYSGNLDKVNFRVHFSDYNNIKSLKSDNLLTCTLDNNGWIWVGSNHYGVFYSPITYRNFKKFSNRQNSKSSLGFDYVTDISEDQAGQIWLSLGFGGVDEFFREYSHFEHFVNKPGDLTSLSVNAATTVCSDDFGNTWVGTWGTALNKKSPGQNKFKQYRLDPKNKHALSNTFITSIYKDRDGVIWFGHTTGLSKYRPKTDDFVNYEGLTKDKKVLHNFVQAIYEDSEGIMWVGNSSGLFMFDKIAGTFTKIVADANDPWSITVSYITSINETLDGLILIGTAAGVNLLDKKTGKFHKITMWEHGLADELVCAIEVDDQGDVWISSELGVSRIKIEKNEKDYNFIVSNFDQKDGTHGSIFLKNSSTKTKDGTMFFGGIGGFTVFNPKEITINPKVPNLEFTDLKIFNTSVDFREKGSPLTKHISSTDSITLNHTQSVFTIAFVALDLLRPDLNQYKYKLEDFDTDWNNTKIRQVTYTNLEAGEYVFKVIASNNDNVWNNEGISLHITVLPPWWKTWWFITIAVSFVIISVISFYLYRVRALKEQQKILEKKVDERTHEIQEQNVLLNDQKEQITKSYQRIEMLSDFGQKLTSTLNIESITQMIYDYVTSVIEIHAFGIGLYDDKTNQILFENFIQGGEEIAPFTRSLQDNDSLSSWCFNEQNPIYINDIQKEYSKYIPALNESSTHKLEQSRILIPLTVNNKKIGVLVLTSFNKNAYSKDDMMNLSTLGSYISIAIDNAQAYLFIKRVNRMTEKSINYARNIQTAFLPSKDYIKRFIDSFVLFRPKDIVSGDFYWFSALEKNPDNPKDFFIAAVDCTGHGVPGAFMSIIGNNLLHEIINIQKLHSPTTIMHHMNLGVQLALKQHQTKNNDGMDIALCRIQEQQDDEFKISFAGAKRPLIHISHETGELTLYKGSRVSVGGLQGKNSVKKYELIEITAKKNDTLYMYSDGFSDQNDKAREKYGRGNLNKFLSSMSEQSMTEQHDALEAELLKFMDAEEQRDDITLIGIRL